MCLGVPARIVRVQWPLALADFGNNVVREIIVGTLDDVKPGDYVIVHAGIAIEKVKLDELERMLRELENLMGGSGLALQDGGGAGGDEGT